MKWAYRHQLHNKISRNLLESAHQSLGKSFASNLGIVVFQPLAQFAPLPACLPRMPECKVTSDGGSEVTACQKIDAIDESGPEIGLDQFLGLLLPWSRHLRSPQILGSKVNLVAVPSCPVSVVEGGGNIEKMWEHKESTKLAHRRKTGQQV